MKKNGESILSSLSFGENQNSEMRHSWLSGSHLESIAEHTCQMELVGLLVHRHLEKPVNLEHTLKMILVHDLVEAEALDITSIATSSKKAQKSEYVLEAIEKMRILINSHTGQEFFDLFQEFETEQSEEAKLAKKLNNLEFVDPI